MKKLLLLSLFGLASALPSRALDAHSVIVYVDKTSKQEDTMQVWITAASATNIEFKRTEQGLNRTRMSRSSIKSIYFYEPPLFKEAMAAYESRDYATAKTKFGECKKGFKAVDDLPGNYGTLAGFYELECCRKLGDLAGLKELFDLYQPASLTRENQRNQLEIYTLWDAVRTKSWERLDGLAVDMLAQKKWTGTHLAQIKYCHGLALEGLDRATDALNAFNSTSNADYTASEIISKKAILNCLRILKGHDEVKLAIELWGTEDEDPNSNGYFLLQEGYALCELWKKSLGAGQPLPAEYTMFLKYKKGSAPKPKPAKKEADKDEAEKKEGDE